MERPTAYLEQERVNIPEATAGVGRARASDAVRRCTSEPVACGSVVTRLRLGGRWRVEAPMLMIDTLVRGGAVAVLATLL
jgi:hypothetical protein